ncbi:uncharacterized protein [Diabrotica undecimpunctata]|uniref:uncharacterized protein isoform X4 n=1 Tax=Diabrotica undecimpunctata TaxID=50387 RepID=UPI003B642454
MEVKQEVNVYICKEEIDNESGNALSDTLKIEIKEEPKRESTNDAFDYLVLHENPIKTEKEIYEDKPILFEEKETCEKSFPHDDIQTDSSKLFKDHDKINSDLDQCVTASTNVNTEEIYFTTKICTKQFSANNNLNKDFPLRIQEKWFYESRNKTYLSDDAVPTIFEEIPKYIQIKGTTRSHSEEEQLFAEKVKNKQKTKQIKVLHQKIRRLQKRVVSLKQIIKDLK